MANDTVIADITITSELWRRPTRAPDMAAEIAAMRSLNEMMPKGADKIFEACVDTALTLCRADTAGISLYEKTETGDEIFRWVALAGEMAPHLSGTTPRHFSPCGICVEGGSALLMRHPEKVYTYLDIGVPIYEALLLPLCDRDGQFEATIWVVMHSPEKKFCDEDAQVMERIAMFTGTALRVSSKWRDTRRMPKEQGAQRPTADA